jgi:hypothetical protein
LTFHASPFCRDETFWVPAKHWKIKIQIDLVNGMFEGFMKKKGNAMSQLRAWAIVRYTNSVYTIHGFTSAFRNNMMEGHNWYHRHTTIYDLAS